MGVTIRTARREDCTQLRAVIQELADYEKMPDGPRITAEQLEKDGFGPHKFFHCEVAESDGQLLGFALYFFTYSTWEGKCVFMEDLYVQPDHRGKGIGTKLWKAVISAGLELECARCNWQCLDWNQSSIEFYERAGAANLSKAEGWLSFRMTREVMMAFVAK